MLVFVHFYCDWPFLVLDEPFDYLFITSIWGIEVHCAMLSRWLRTFKYICVQNGKVRLEHFRTNLTRRLDRYKGMSIYSIVTKKMPWINDLYHCSYRRRENNIKDNRCSWWNNLSVIYYHHLHQYTIFYFWSKSYVTIVFDTGEKILFHLSAFICFYCVKIKARSNNMESQCGWWSE